MLIVLLSADYLSRGRMSDINDNGNDGGFLIFVGIVLILLLCVIIAAYFWQVHREKLKALGRFILICGVLYIIGCIANLIWMTTKDMSNSNIENNTRMESIEVIAEPVPPICETDAWANYPPVSEVKTEGRGNDFLVAATSNPSYSLYDLIRYAGINSRNTQFLSESEYTKSRWVRQHYTPDELHSAYRKLSSAWQAFLRCDGADVNNPEIEKYMMHYDMFDTDKPNINDAFNPKLIKDLKRIPLQSPREF